MMSRGSHMRILGVATAALLLLVACGGEASPPASTPAPSSSLTSSVPAMPVAGATDVAAALPCAALQEPLAHLLERTIDVRDATVRDVRTGQEYAGCRMEATGSAEQWGDAMTASQNLGLVLSQRGWGPGVHLADGPTGTLIGFANTTQHLQLAVNWQPAPGASCPADQPIAACALPPAQQQITIVLEGY